MCNERSATLFIHNHTNGTNASRQKWANTACDLHRSTRGCIDFSHSLCARVLLDAQSNAIGVTALLHNSTFDTCFATWNPLKNAN